MNVNRAKDTKITTMRLSRHVLAAAQRKAKQKGISRTLYIEQLIRRDLRMPEQEIEAGNGVFA